MRLASVIYFLPFFMVMNTAFILRASWDQIIFIVGCALIGITMISGALQGYLVGVGNLTTQRQIGWLARALILAGGFLFALPGGGVVPFSNLTLNVTGLLLGGSGASLVIWFNRRFSTKVAP